MTIKGIKKLTSKPNIFFKDYVKKKFTDEELKVYGHKALELDLAFDKYYYFLFQIFKDNKNRLRAEEAIKKAISKKKKSDYYYELAKLLKEKKQWWQVIDASEKAIRLKSKVPNSWYTLYAYSLEKMSRFNEAVVVLEKLYNENRLNADWLFTYGVLLEKVSREEEAKKVFEKVIKKDNKYNSKKLGIGIFYEKRSHFFEALYAYSESVIKNPINENLQYKKSFSYDKLYQWKKAEEGYLLSIGLNPDNIDWSYRLAFVRERQGNFLEASISYEYAARHRKKHTPYWYYRLGYVLQKLGKYESSCYAFLMMRKIVLEENESISSISIDKNFIDKKKREKVLDVVKLLKVEIALDSTNITLWKKLAKTYESIEEYEEVISIYKKIIARNESFDSTLYFRLAYFLTKNYQYKEASEVFIQQRILQDAHGVSEATYTKNKKFQNIVNYTEYYENLGIDENTILYESYHGSSISCSPYAIFKSLLFDNRFTDFKHIWVVSDKNKIPLELKKHENIIFISRNCDRYMRYLASAKYLINNTSFPDWYIRKEEQVYLNTWHGTPIKTLGRDVKEDFMAHKNQTRNFLQASHLISPNRYTTDITLDSYDIRDTFSGIFATTGYPRQDLMLNISQEEKELIKKRLKLSNKKIILYAPTWRGTVGKAVFDVEKLISDIKEIQTIGNIQVLFRGHYMVEKTLANLNIGVTVVPSEIDTNSLLSIVDILITDYSSICFDFMALEKPILYYVYDRKVYEEERGLYFSLEELGGELCNSIIHLKDALNHVLKEEDITTIQKKAQKKFCSYDDGSATQRVINLLFFNQLDALDIYVKSPKESILLYGGPLMANGITTSFINLVNHIDQEKYIVTIVIDPNAIKMDELRMEQFNKFNRNIKIVPRVGQLLGTLEERWILGQFNLNMNLFNDEQWNFYEQLHQREFKRVFGYGRYDHIVNFEGYTVFWTTLMGMKSSTNQTNAVYQHNDLFGEWKMKHYYLEQTFNLYRFYDKYVSVSEATKELNKDNLANLFHLEKEKFIHCDNLQNPKVILDKSQEELEVKADVKIFNGTKVFINIGRLSPEKGHSKLIHAFSKVVVKYPEARLVNLGDGVLKEEIYSLILELKLKNKVFFLGQRSNPYTYLKKSDCFILSSDHEGQPMTLFEALILKKPIIATDIVGNRSVIDGRSGLIVDNSEEGLIQGMTQFLAGEYVDSKVFDYVKYNQDALDMFYTKVLRK